MLYNVALRKGFRFLTLLIFSVCFYINCKGLTYVALPLFLILFSAPFLTYVTGGGTSSTLCISNDDVYSSALSNNDINKYLKTYGKVDGTKSLELEERSSIWKEKLPRVKSCRGPELATVEKGADRRTNRGLSRRKSDFDAVGLKLWKLSRESFRSKACRVEFV